MPKPEVKFDVEVTPPKGFLSKSPNRANSFLHSTNNGTEGYLGEEEENQNGEPSESRGKLPPLATSTIDTMSLGENSRRQSWFTTSTASIYEPLHHILMAGSNDMVEKFKVMLKGPEFDNDDILCAVHTFMKSLADYIPSVKFDKTFETVRGVRKLVSQPESVRLYGLLTHYCYWNIIHVVAKKVMLDLRSHEPKANLYQGIDLINEAPDRAKLPKALRDNIVEQSKRLKQQQRQNSLEEIDDMFHSEAHSSPHELDAHVEDAFQQGMQYDHQSETGNSFGAFSFETSMSNASLTLQEKENLYVQLETCIVAIFRKVSTSF